LSRIAARSRAHSREAFEKNFGFSHAIRVGKFIFVSGTTAFDESGEIIPSVDSYEQAKKAIQNIERALKKLGSSLDDVVRTYVYVGPSTDWRKVGLAHGEFFGSTMPVSTFLWNSFFSDPRVVVEIEADAITR
jgi:enamine deaminase RidA (YjgF/YER057c/UK114 family)